MSNSSICAIDKILSGASISENVIRFIFWMERGNKSKVDSSIKYKFQKGFSLNTKIAPRQTISPPEE